MKLTEKRAMSACVDIYVSIEWNTSVSNVLTAAGFSVALRERKLASGISGCEYSCTYEGKAISLTVSPIPNDSFYLTILGLCRPKHTATLLQAYNLLIQDGAFDSNHYKQQSRNA